MKTAPQTPPQTAREQTDKGPSFIAIEAVGRLSYGRDLRLKAGDVFVAVDGNPITWDIDKFDQILASYKELPALFTIFRKGEFLKCLSISRSAVATAMPFR